MKSQFRAINRFISKIKATSSIDGTSSSGTFQVDDISVGGFSLPQGAFTYFVTADFAQTGKEEIFRIVNTVGDVLTYDKRISVGGYVKPAHAAGASIRVNDVADILNEMSDNIDNFGDVNQIDGTQTVKVFGGVFNNSGIVYNISNQTFIITAGQLVDNTTNYIHFDLITRLFVVSSSSTYGNGVCLASVVVASGIIGTIVDLRPGFSSAYGPFPSQTGNSGKVLYTDGTNTSWQTVASLLPNASSTVSGKVEIATQAQVNAGTSVGETGSLLAVSPPELVAGFSPLGHTHVQYSIVKNGTYTESSVAAGPNANQDKSSNSTGLISTPTIARFIASHGSTNSTGYLMVSSDNISFSPLYTYSTNVDFTFLLLGGRYYKTRSVTTATSGSVVVTTILIYTV